VEKIIHNIWIGPYKLPDMPKYFIQRSKEINKEFEHILWTDENLPTLPDKIKELCDFHYKTKHFALAADVLRVYLVYEFGGFYLDIDTRPNNSIEELNLENYDGILPYHNEYTVANTFFGCTKKRNYIAHLYNLLLKSKSGDNFMPYWFNSGIKEYFGIKEVHDYFSEECQIIGRQLLKKWEEQKIRPIPINGEFKKYYEHFAMYSWGETNLNYLKEGNINYMDTIYKVNYKL